FYILLHSSLRGHFENLNDLISDLGQRFQLLIRWLRLSWWLRLSKPLCPFCTLRRTRGGCGSRSHYFLFVPFDGLMVAVALLVAEALGAAFAAFIFSDDTLDGS